MVTAMITLCRINHCEVMISSFVKVMGLQTMFVTTKTHDFRHRKVIQHDRSGYIIHTIHFC